MQMIFPIRKNVCNLMHENAGKSRLSAQLGDAGLYPASKNPGQKRQIFISYGCTRWRVRLCRGRKRYIADEKVSTDAAVKNGKGLRHGKVCYSACPAHVDGVYDYHLHVLCAGEAPAGQAGRAVWQGSAAD
jgi:hypothetical protein